VPVRFKTPRRLTRLRNKSPIRPRRRPRRRRPRRKPRRRSELGLLGWTNSDRLMID
jgi:hypothetical protein